MSEDSVLIAVSGGLDSMVLLDLMQKTDISIAVAHFDHLTRDGQSTQDAEHVKKYCETHNIEFHLGKMSLDYENKNFQDEAHKQRYKFFQSLNFNKILTAHHKDDKTETILLNIFRGKSIYGINDISNNVYRPLMIFSKNEIESYAVLEKIVYVTDSSNSKNEYDRNFVRNEIIPQLSNRFEEFSGRINSLSQSLAHRDNAIKELSNIILNPLLTNSSISIKKNNINRILELSNPEIILHQCIKNWGFNIQQSKNIIDTLNKTGNTFFSNSHQLLIDRDRLFINDFNVIKPSLEVQINQGDQKIRWRDYIFTIEPNSNEEIVYANDIAYIDSTLVGESVIIRTWEEGDYFFPLNMDGKKQTLKKYFINSKLNRFEKSEIPIITNHDNQVIWITGMRLDDRFKTKNPKSPFLKISFSKIKNQLLSE